MSIDLPNSHNQRHLLNDELHQHPYENLIPPERAMTGPGFGYCIKIDNNMTRCFFSFALPCFFFVRLRSVSVITEVLL